MQNKGPYYITTAIAYTSGKPHIGNTYEIIMADNIARYKRADGYDVYFQTGSDEHGRKLGKEQHRPARHRSSLLMKRQEKSRESGIR